MLSLSIGPIALPTAPLLLAVVTLCAAWLARRLAGPAAAPRADAAVWAALIWGLVAARAAHLALNGAAYRAEPWAAIDIRDGGWNAAAGWAVAAGRVAWQAWREAAVRRALAAAAAFAGLAWAGASLALGAQAPADLAEPALAVALESRDGSPPRPLAELVRGRAAVVNLWASWCGPCRAEMPMLAAAQAREADVEFLFVNQGEPTAAIDAYLQGSPAPLRNVWRDPASRLGRAVGSAGLPTTLFFDARGRLVDAHFGVLNAAALRVRLQSLRGADEP